MALSSQKLDVVSSKRLAVAWGGGRYAYGMSTVIETRRQNLATLIERAGGQAALARKIGKDKNQVNQWMGRAGKRNISDASARQVETAMGLPEGWLDHGQGGAQEPPATYTPVTRIEQEIGAIAGVLRVFLAQYGARQPAEAAVLALEIRRHLARPEYEGEVLQELLHALEDSVPPVVRGARASGE